MDIHPNTERKERKTPRHLRAQHGTIDLRVGKVVSVEPVAGSEKLLQFGVDIGEAVPRQILSGVAKVYSYEELLGKNVIVVANLETRVMAGVESRGMLIGVEQDHNGRPLLLFPENDIVPGTRLS